MSFHPQVIVLGASLQVIAYALEAAGTVLPFPAFVLGYAINGIGGALQDAQANAYVAGLRDNKEAKMGMLHAAYGGYRSYAFPSILFCLLRFAFCVLPSVSRL